MTNDAWDLPDHPLPAAVITSDLLLALYRGPLESPLWSGFLRLLRRELAADYASLVFHKFDAPLDQSIKLSDSDRPRGSRGIDIVERLYSSTGFPYEDLPCGQPFLIEEFLDKNNSFHEAYLTEFLYPRGHRHMLVMRVVEPGGSSAILTISCRESQIAESAKPCFSALADHMAVAIQYLATMEKEYHRAVILSTALRRLNFGSLTFDRQGEIIDIDKQALQLLEAAGVLRRTPHGRQRIELPRHGQAVRNALEHVLLPEAPQSGVLHLSDEPRIEMLVVPIVERPVSGDRTPVAIGYVHGDKILGHDQAERLVELFGLSSREADLALALCNGLTITEAAAELGLTYETARTYSKRIYSKTGTRGHVDLVRLILASVIVVA